jgi:hypothetical protein
MNPRHFRDVAMNDVWCDNPQDCLCLGTHIPQIAFWRTMSVIQWYLISMALDLFCLIVSFKIPNTVELSVLNGVVGCW